MGAILSDEELTERRFVFATREEAGERLGAFLRPRLPYPALLVAAIPAGGVPVGAGVARALRAPLEPAIVRKILIPGSTEAGFGAVAWDGRVLINDDLRSALGLTRAEVDAAVKRAAESVRGRVGLFRGGRPFPALEGRTTVVVDDGLASGFTMLAAIEALKTGGTARVVVAVPTASASAAARVAREVDLLVCLNIRSGGRFAVAEAYRDWYDLDDAEVIRILRQHSAWDTAGDRG